ncbi:unnamed protein product [Vitrella brassicaformis CCMP3155]|uniref:HIT domain-containing protein n=2 Tax=Vitrella brassicaformis TaxID=1169539 RepID=A0A0G4F2S0_VITBC|nr:unnamed protein product [Vitrella brassicaformis CCMP3155]|eukprot:CEM05689.1 unnamed protein product [Vitrella brassicaformis CCMP3155]
MVQETLYDMPISNHGARCRMIVYKKGIEDRVTIRPPGDLGGLKSEEYLKINPQGKMPTYVTDGGLPIPESDPIARYLINKYQGVGVSFVPADATAQLRSDIVGRLHDVYISPIQGAMYKAAPPFGPFDDRQAALSELKRQLETVEACVSPDGPYITGSEISLADATLFPTMVFITYILPEQFGWQPADVLPPKLARWFQWMQANEPSAKRVFDEITGVLKGWSEKGRWTTILGAGLKDQAPATLFDKIMNKQVSADIVHEDDRCMAIRDINPQGPTHVLLFPKRRDNLTQLRQATEEHKGILGHLLVTAAKLARDEGFEAYRIVINDGPKACQSVFHLHVHLIGGRSFSWPPG